MVTEDRVRRLLKQDTARECLCNRRASPTLPTLPIETLLSSAVSQDKWSFASPVWRAFEIALPV